MERVAKKVTDYILERNVITEEDYAIYKYGLQTGMETGLCMVVSAIISIFLHAFWEYVVLILMFFPLRSYVGGIHMKRFCSCFVCSCAAITVGLCFSMKCTLADNKMILPICLLMIIVHKLAYITIAKQADRKEAEFYALQRKRIFCVLGVCLFLFWTLHLSRFIALMLYMLIVVLVSLVMEMIATLLREKYEG